MTALAEVSAPRRQIARQRGNLAVEIIENRIVVAGIDQSFQIGNDIGIDPVGRHDPRVRARGGLGDQLVQKRADPLDPGDIGFRVFEARNAMDVDEESRQRCVRSAAVIEQETVFTERVKRGAAVGQCLEQAV